MFPLVVVGGLGNEAVKETPLTTETVEIALEISEYAAAKAIDAKLRNRSKTSTANIGSAAVDIVHRNSTPIYTKRERPSILSPRNKDSSLYPDKLFTLDWLRKYSEYLPTTVVGWYDLGACDDDSDLEARLRKLQSNLLPQNINFVAIVTAPASMGGEELATRAAALRRATGLQPRTGLLVVPGDFSPLEIDTFVETLWQLLLGQAATFFAGRAREVRHKRDNLAISTDTIMWDARYTFKLAVFSELKADLRGALRLYESTYDVIRGLFEEGLTPATNAGQWCSARELLDLIAAKIARLALALPDPMMAARKFRFHIRSIAKIADVANVALPPAWTAAQNYALAQEAARAQEHARDQGAFVGGPEPNGPTAALPRAGFLYLAAAETSAPSKRDGLQKDPYVVPQVDIDNAFALAAADLEQFPATLGHLYVQWGNHLLKEKPEEAARKYRDALSVLHPKWSQRAQIAEKLLQIGTPEDKAVAQLAIFSSDKTADVDLGELADELFTIEGTFASSTTYLGRKVTCQITVIPRFTGKLALSAIKVPVIGRTLALENDENAPNKRLYGPGDPVNLVFSDQEPKTFELETDAEEPGEYYLEQAQVFGTTPAFFQTYLIKTTYAWLNSPIGPSTTRHLRLARPRRAEVLSRPAQLSIAFANCPKTVAPGEQVRVAVNMISTESETSHVDVKVLLAESDLPPVQVHAGHVTVEANAEQEMPFTYTAPAASFKILIQTSYTTDTDKMPVLVNTDMSVDTTTPLRTTCNLTARLHAQQWPNMFVPSTESGPTPIISRAWQLSVSVLALAADGVVLHRIKLAIDSDDAIVDLPTGSVVPATADVLAHNQLAQSAFDFSIKRKDRDLRTLDGEAKLELQWSRPATPDIINKLAVPPLRLSLPQQEPRVLCVLASKNGGARTAVEFYIENATTHILTFAVTMSASPDYAVQGSKGCTVRMLPFTRRRLAYEMVALTAGKNRPLPALRVFDTHYKRPLVVVPASNGLFKGPNGICIE